MEKKRPQRALPICPLCGRPIVLDQHPSVKFEGGQEVHAECYEEHEQEESARQKINWR